jgi:dTMP kinase
VVDRARPVLPAGVHLPPPVGAGGPAGATGDAAPAAEPLAQALREGASTRGDGSGGLFASRSYRRLYAGQVVSSLGDWVGFVAVTALAGRLDKSSPELAVGIVLSARLIPGFFFGSFASAFLDRWDRKRTMVACDIGRGLVMASLPFVRNIPGLFVASLILELLTLLWSPAKDASVPNLVRPEHLAAANSLGLVAAYGTIFPGALIFTGLTTVANILAHVHVLRLFRLNQESLAIYFDVLTFFCSAALIKSLTLPRGPAAGQREGNDSTLQATFRDAREGWRYVGRTRLVRSVMLGFCTGLIGGGMVVPLGVAYSDRLLGKGSTGFGLLESSLGFGVALGVVTLSLIQKRVSHTRIFTVSVIGAGASLLVAASTSQIGMTMLFIALFGLCAGAVYVLGFTILQANTADAIRGRVLGLFYTLVRFCLLLAFVLAPLLSGLLDRISADYVNRQVTFWGWRIAVPGVRLTLWMGGIIIVGAGAITWRGMRVSGEGAEAVASVQSGE